MERVAQQLKELSPANAKYARWGGEEFTLLLPEHSLEQAINAVRIIQQSIEQHDFSDLAPLLNITVSVGVASVENAGDYNRLLNHADQALYRAKQTGRNKVESELS
ncbi:GGDEF domain-containing protein [Alteromonas sp. KUL42]|uniref:GGDEF domain-containing protein n=1 Tax=Alteromonas sp. KUL42 TaxID=2480797 RepID=UPI002415D59A|nr:GGDEF domain-containing protein [Alteromonas sp. KUL42]